MMGGDRRESTLEVQHGLLEWCEGVHRQAQLARLAAGITHQDAAQVRTHCADVRAAIGLARTRRRADSGEGAPRPARQMSGVMFSSYPIPSSALP
jgi:hypothetical protein